MKLRLLLALCACLVLGIGLWLTTSAPPAVPDRGQRGPDGAGVAEARQGRALELADRGGPAGTQARGANPVATTPRDEDSLNPGADRATQFRGSFDTPGAGERGASPNSQEAATPVLSEGVFAVIEQVQSKQLDGQWEESLLALNALYEDFDDLNSFEQTTMLNFYTNTLLRFEMWPEAIGAFSRMLTIADLRPDLGARALMALGQLHARVGEYAASITYLTSWQEMTAGTENIEQTRLRVAQLLDQSRIALQQTNLEEQ